MRFTSLEYEVKCINSWSELIKIQSTQIPGTATFLNKCGDITVLGKILAMFDLNSGLSNACLLKMCCGFPNDIINECGTASNSPMQLGGNESGLLFESFCSLSEYL
jgi:hypothetical protein